MEKIVNDSLINSAIAHYEYGIRCDIFSEPVLTYAKMAVEALRAQLVNAATEKKVPNKWISVKKELPKKNGEYLTVNTNSGRGKWYDLCHYNVYYKTFTLSGTTGPNEIRYPTHWMPLPESPLKKELCKQCR